MSFAGAQRGMTATIANGANTSDAVDLLGKDLAGFIMPDAWTAAGLKFQVAYVGDAFSGDNTYRDLYVAGTLFTLAVGASQQVAFDNDTLIKFRGVRHVKFVSWNIAGVAVVNQGAARTIIPIVI